jgi:enoyl-CoA hydratase
MTNSETYTGIDDLSVTSSDGILSVTLNRPGSLNSLTAEMFTTIAAVMERAAGDPAVRVVRIGGAGRAFSSGAGIGADDYAEPGADGTPEDVLHAANRAVRSIVAIPKPVVSVVHGPAAGVGVSLAIAADLVLASDEAYFLLAFTRIGLMPDGGASALVAASIGRTRAMRMALLAERLPAADALAAGLVSAVYPADELEAGVTAVLDRLKSGPAVALRKTKQAVNAATLTALDDALARETDGQLALLSSPDFREGAKAFQQRRPATFTDD